MGVSSKEHACELLTINELKKFKYVKELELKIEKLQKALKIASDTIEFYGDIISWEGLEINNDHYTNFQSGSSNIFIGGKKARQAKQQIKEILKGSEDVSQIYYELQTYKQAVEVLMEVVNYYGGLSVYKNPWCMNASDYDNFSQIMDEDMELDPWNEDYTAWYGGKKARQAKQKAQEILKGLE